MVLRPASFKKESQSTTKEEEEYTLKETYATRYDKNRDDDPKEDGKNKKGNILPAFLQKY